MNPNDITDIKPPVDLPPDLIWVWVMLGLLLLAIAIFMIRKLLAKKQSPNVPIILQTPYEKAIEQLKALYVKQLLKQGLVKEYFDGISDIVRVYIESSFDIHAPHMSTEEFLVSLQGSIALSDAHKALLKDMLVLADMVKFAKHIPSVNDGEAFYKHALNFIEESHRV